VTSMTEDPQTGPAASWAVPTGAWSVRDLVTELAKAEDALRSRPGDTEALARVRVLVRELRRRRARMRLEARLSDRSPL
jgi:hypothetical protein